MINFSNCKSFIAEDLNKYINFIREDKNLKDMKKEYKKKLEK